MTDKYLHNKPVALIVDDQESICNTLAGVLSDEGWGSQIAHHGKEALDAYKKHHFDLILLDVWMKEMDGITVLQKMKEIKDHIPIVIMSGHATIETAVKATKLGAYDFLEKPLSLEKILPMLEHAQKLKPLRGNSISFQENQYKLIGVSEFTAAIHRQIKVIAPRNSWVLITGENGTGKEVVARNIHLHSSRAEKAFVAVNCAAIPEELIESELFGFKKGAFTNALETKKGKFELANQGTLFLDEIGDMSLKTQAKILRILQEQNFERIGDDKTISIDVRVIAATNKNLQEEIKQSRFREDLFYRLNVIPMHMMPLRERSEDIPILADYFLNQMAVDLAEPKKTLQDSAIKKLINYPWPGNVRELKNLMERLMILVNKVQIEAGDLPEYINKIQVYSDDDMSEGEESATTLKAARTLFEKSFILEKLEENDWNISKTAEAIGIERSNLHRKLRSFEIDLKRIKP